MTTENMSARQALDEVARRREQTLQAGNRDWTWPRVGLTCAVLLVMGVGYDLNWLWLVAVALVGIVLTSATVVKLRRETRGPGAGFTIGLMGFMIVTLVLFQGVWRGLDLPFPSTAGMVGACLILLSITPLAQRRVAARNARAAGAVRP